MADNLTVTDGAIAEWKDREAKLSVLVTGTIAWYSTRMKRNWLAQRSISVVVMVCGVVAPLLVAGTGTVGFFNVSAEARCNRDNCASFGP
ncbi:hypothetical protein GFM44_30795 [Rhizobium leguminosarum bv. viciae]|nr:hypothetical protein [Rhizobium leguminosarum bv. viciae]